MKTNEIPKKIFKYLRELSVVVVGIVITFGLSNWISIRNEKKDMQRYLEAVKSELQDNLTIVQDQFDFYYLTGKFAKYLQSEEQDKLRTDSLAKYYFVRGYVPYMVYKTSAFEALKFSGAMSLIKNQELLKSIIDCYKFMEYAKNGGDKYLDTKWNELYNVFMELGAPKNDFDIRDPKYRRIFNFFSVDVQGAGNFEECVLQIKKTLALFPEKQENISENEGQP